MAGISNLQQKINSYLSSHTELNGKSEAVILSAMMEEGVITKAELDSAKATSAFGFGFSKSTETGLEIERNISSPRIVPINRKAVQITELTEKQAQDYAIETISQNMEDALQIYMSMDNGIVSKGYDNLKEFFDTELSSKNIYDVILKEDNSLKMLNKAQKGELTKREYYESNKDLLETMLYHRFLKQDETGVSAIDKYRGQINTKDFEQIIKQYIESKIEEINTIEGIKGLQHDLIMMSEEENSKLLENMSKEALAENLNGSSDTTNIFKVKTKEHPYMSDEKMTFEETYMHERGTEFSTQKQELLMQSKGELDFATSVYNKVSSLANFVNKSANRYKEDSKEYYDQKTGFSTQQEPDAENRKNEFLELIKNYYVLNDNQALEDLCNICEKSQLNFRIGRDEDDNISLEFGELYKNDTQRNKALNFLMKGLVKQQEERMKEILGGKDFNTYALAHRSCYESALGKDNAQEIAQAMQEDNMTVIDNVMGVASTGGMLVMVVGGVLAVIPPTSILGTALTSIGVKIELWGTALTSIGGKIALGGMAARNALGLTEAYTRKEVQEEELSQRYKDLAMDIGGFLVGSYAGKLGLQKGTAFINKSGNFLAGKVIEHGIDFSISLAGDMAMVAAMSYDQSILELIKQNGVGILVSTMTGLSTSKAYLLNKNKKLADTPADRITSDTNRNMSNALSADGFRNRVNQKFNQLYIRLQSIDGKYSDAAADRIDMSTPPEVFSVIDATPEELARFIEKYTKEVPFADGTVQNRIVIGNAIYTKESLQEQIGHLRNMREFLDTQSIPAKMTVHRSDSYSIMEQVNINGRSLAEIMKEAVENNNMDDVLKILNKGDTNVKYDNFIGTSLQKLNWNDTNIQWEINVPKGSKGAYVELMTKENIPEEKEFLLQAGSTFKIRSAEFKDGVWQIKADLVQETKAAEKSTNAVKTEKGVLEGGIRAEELDEVAPEARHLVESENITAERKYIENLESNLKRKMSDAESVEERQVIQDIIDKTTPENKELVDMMAKDENISNELALQILNSMTKIPDRCTPRSLLSIASQIMFKHPSKYEVKDPLKAEYAKKMVANENVPKEMIPNILEYLQKGNSHLLDMVLEGNNKDFSNIVGILRNTLVSNNNLNHFRYDVSDAKVRFAEYLLKKQDFPNQYIAEIVDVYGHPNIDSNFVKQLCDNPDFPKSEIRPLMENIRKNKVGDNQALYSQEAKFKSELAQRLVSDKNCPNELISDIIGSISKNQKKLFEAIYADENIQKSEIASILYLDYGLKKGVNKLEFEEKIGILTSSAAVSEKTLKYLEKYGFDKVKTDKLVNDIALEMGINGKYIKTSEADKKLLFKNYIANNGKVEKLVTELDLNKFTDGIPLKYKRSDFISDIQNLLKDLPEQERVEVLNHFGIEIKNGTMEGIPIVPDEKGVFNEAQSIAAEKIAQKINDFTLNNETTIKDPEIKELFDSLIKGCPEFATVIGKVQHTTHQYKVDIHTLKVLQNAMKNPDYQKLDNENKTVLKFAILLHDLGKQEGVIDKGHYETSAKYAVSIMNKYNLPDRVKSRIIETIYNHHWFEAYNKGNIGPEMVNAIYRTPRDLDVAVIMGKADLMGVSDDFHLRITKTGTQDRFEEFWHQKIQTLYQYQNVRYGKANLVMDTKFHQTESRRFPTREVEIDGVKYEMPVLNLMDEATSYDLSEYGFAPGTTKDNARFFAHFNNRIKGLKVTMALSSSPSTESVQSLSLISKANSRSYKQQIYGLVMDVDMKNVAQASSENIGSGYKKDLKHFSKDLFGFLRTNSFVRDCLIDELNNSSIKLSTDEYTQLAEKIVDIQYAEQVTKDIKIGDKTIPAEILQRALKASRDKLFDGDLHSEIIAINPRVKALVARVSSLEECSPEFLKLAQENNLPIILIGHNDKSGVNPRNKTKIETEAKPEELKAKTESAKRPYDALQVHKNNSIESAKELMADTSKPEAPHKPYAEMTDAEFETAKAEFAEDLKSKFNYFDMRQIILSYTNKENMELAKIMCADKDFPQDIFLSILSRTNQLNIELAKELCTDKDFAKWRIPNLIEQVNTTNAELVNIICANKDFPRDKIGELLIVVNETNIDVAKFMCSDKEFPNHLIAEILKVTNNGNSEFAKELVANKNMKPHYKADVLRYTNEENVELARLLCSYPEDVLIRTNITDVLKFVNKINIDLAKKLCSDESNFVDRSGYEIGAILAKTNDANIDFAKYLCAKKELPLDSIYKILEICKDKKRTEFVKILYADNIIPKNIIPELSLPDLAVDAKIDIYNILKADKDFPQDKIVSILNRTDEENIDIAKMLCADKNFSAYEIHLILRYTNETNVELAKQLCADKDFPKKEISYILDQAKRRNLELAELMYAEKFPPEFMGDALRNATETSINVYNKIKDNPDIPVEFKARIIATGREDLVNAIPKLVNQYNNMLKNPLRYINGEMSNEEAVKNIKFYIEHSMEDVLGISDSLDKEALDNLFRRRLDDVKEYIMITRLFELEDFEVLKQINNACNIDGKPLMPTQKVEAIDLIQSYKDCGLDVSKLMPTDGKIDLGGAKLELFSHVMELAGLTKEEIAQIPKEKLVAWDTTYAHLMAKEVDEPAMRDLLRAANFDNFERYIHDVSNEYGKSNAKTQEIYKAKNMNYDAWLHPDKSNEITFKAIDKNQEKLMQISDQVVEDIETLRQTPAKDLIDKQFPQSIKNGKFFIPAEHLTSKEKLAKFVALLADTSDKGQLKKIWERAKANSTKDDPDIVVKARNTLTILDHLNQRLDDISKVEKAASTKSFDVTIKMWDRVPQKDIFQGNYSTCCIGMGGGNGSAMPHYLLNTSYNMIELVDNNTGKTIGNALCYFVTGSDGKPKFIIDNIEINNGAKPSDEVGKALRQQMTNYADNVAREVTGRDDIEIFMSSNYNDVPTEDLKVRQDKISFLGETGCDEIYMDLYNGWVGHDADGRGNRTESYTQDCNLLKLTPDKPVTKPVNSSEVKSGTQTSIKQVLRHELSSMKTHSADGTANPRFTPAEIDNLLNNFTYTDKNGNIHNNAENIVKLLKLKKYKDVTANEIAQIARKYDKNLGELVKLGNIPETDDKIMKIKASDSYKVIEKRLRKTADGKNKILEIKKLNPEVEEQLRIVAKQLRAKALGIEKSIVEFMKANNLTTDEYEFTHRSKSEQGLFDKMKNYLLDSKNADKTVADAKREVLDAVGTRTIIPTRDYTDSPEVKALLEKGNREDAINLAMKLQTEEMITNLTNFLTKLKANGVENIGVIRFNNYMGNEGMPYISVEQLIEIKKNIDVEFDNLTTAGKVIFAQNGIELTPEHFKIKIRDSGYTAFQANFKTKDGYIFEWQFRGERVNEFAEAEHVPYDLRTDKDIISSNPNAKEILEPIQSILSVEKMKDDDFVEYNKYLTDYYRYCRELELGFKDAKMKVKFNSSKFDIRLKAENLITLHKYSELLNKAKNQEEINKLVAQYKAELIN